jgi:hypothetical protein
MIRIVRCAAHAISESLGGIYPSEKGLVIAIVAVLMYLRIASWAGFDPRLVVGTAVGVLLSLATLPILFGCRSEP